MKSPKTSKKPVKSNRIKAVILAAGESSRFRPISDNSHKSLVKIYGKPLVRHTVDSAINGGVEEIILVHSPGDGEKFKEVLGDLGKKIHYFLYFYNHSLV